MEDFIPVFAVWAHAPDRGVLRLEHCGGQVSGLVGVISAEDSLERECVGPFRHCGGGSGGGDDDVDLRPVGEGPCREGVDGSLDEERGFRFCLSRDPEAAVGFAASRGHGPEGPVGAGTDQLGAGFPALPVTAGEDGIGAFVGAENADAPAVFDQAWIEPPVPAQVATHPCPCPVFGEDRGFVSGAWVAGCEAFEKLKSLEEAASLGLDDQVDERIQKN